MKKLSFILLSATFLTSMAFGNTDKVVATYNNSNETVDVKESQVVQQFNPLLMQAGQNKQFAELPLDTQEALVRAYINMSLLKQEADKSGIMQTAEFKTKLENVASQLAQQELVENYVNSHVTEKMINADYTKLVADLKNKKEIKVSHILVPTEKEAIDIKSKLSKGAKFAELAKKYSKDEGSKANGGDIGYIIPGQLVPEFEKEAFALKINDISTPVQTQFGWHIITVSDKRDIKINEKEAKAGITEKLRKQAQQQYFENLTNKADIKIMLPKPEITTDKAEGN